MLAELVATLSSGLFAGVAVYINFIGLLDNDPSGRWVEENGGALRRI